MLKFPPNKDYLTVAEMCDVLGVSRHELLTMCAVDGLPVENHAGKHSQYRKLRFFVSDVKQWWKERSKR